MIISIPTLPKPNRNSQVGNMLELESGKRNKASRRMGPLHNVLVRLLENFNFIKVTNIDWPSAVKCLYSYKAKSLSYECLMNKVR